MQPGLTHPREEVVPEPRKERKRHHARDDLQCRGRVARGRGGGAGGNGGFHPFAGLARWL